MTDVYIPFEIQSEIMKRLPVKSLIRFTSVSKPWKSFIHSSEFIHDHHIMQSQHHLLLRYYVPSDGIIYKDDKYMSLVDDDTFPRHKTCMNIPRSITLLDNPRLVVGSSGGLFLFYSFNGYINDHSLTTNAIIWNPTIKKSVAIDVPNMLQTEDSYNSIVGFGVSSRTNDIVLVKITFDTRKQVEYPTIPCQVEVFTLSLGYWRSLRSNLPRKSITFSYKQVVIDDFIYWRAYNNYCGDGDQYNLVMSFNMISEEFTELYFPESLASSNNLLFISKLRESLAVVQNDGTSNVTIWTLHNCDPKLFTKLFTFSAPNITGGDVFIFRPSGELIIMKNKYYKEDELFVYESNSQEVNFFWLSRELHIVCVTPYIESLLLLDHKDNANILKRGANMRRGLNYWANKIFLRNSLPLRSLKLFCHENYMPLYPNGIETTKDHIHEAYECQT